MLNQLMVGLQAGPIKQELSLQLRRQEQVTFAAACKEAQTLEQELPDGDNAIRSQRITAPTSLNSSAVNANCRAPIGADGRADKGDWRTPENPVHQPNGRDEDATLNHRSGYNLYRPIPGSSYCHTTGPTDETMTSRC